MQQHAGDQIWFSIYMNGELYRLHCWDILRLPHQSSQDLAHRESETLTICKNDICKHWCQRNYITILGNRLLGVALGSTLFVEGYTQCKVSQWVDTVKRLFCIAHKQPHATYSTLPMALLAMELLDAHHPRHL